MYSILFLNLVLFAWTSDHSQIQYQLEEEIEEISQAMTTDEINIDQGMLIFKTIFSFYKHGFLEIYDSPLSNVVAWNLFAITLVVLTGFYFICISCCGITITTFCCYVPIFLIFLILTVLGEIIKITNNTKPKNLL